MRLEVRHLTEVSAVEEEKVLRGGNTTPYKVDGTNEVVGRLIDGEELIHMEVVAV